MTQQKMRSLSEKTYLDRYTSPKEEVVNPHWMDGGEERPRKFDPLLAPFSPLPLETRFLHCVDPETKEENETGVIRFWIDMISAEGNYSEANFHTRRIPFEVRLTCWTVNGISIWQDMGQRNDLYVKGAFIAQGIKGNLTQRDFQTDVHKFSHDRAVFNYRWVMDLEMPVLTAAFKFRLCDSDSLTGDDPIYDPKFLPLDHMFQLAYRKEVNDEKPLGTATRQVVFDTWGADKTSGTVGCCGLFRTADPTAAIMTVDVQILPKRIASKDPVGEGRDGPHPLPPPTQRMEWASAVAEPVRFTKVMVGPVCWARSKGCCLCLFILAILMTILALMFFGSQTFSTMR